MAKQFRKYTTNHCIVYSKRVDFMVCEFYLHCNKKGRGTRSRIDGRGVSRSHPSWKQAGHQETSASPQHLLPMWGGGSLAQHN